MMRLADYTLRIINIAYLQSEFAGLTMMILTSICKSIRGKKNRGCFRSVQAGILGGSVFWSHLCLLV